MRMTIETEQRIRNAANQLRAWGGVAILGAGVSLRTGFPLTQDLNNLLWHSIDQSETACQSLALVTGEGAGAPVRQSIGDDPSRVALGYGVLRSDASARQSFQQGFASLDRERRNNHSFPHDIIAQLIHRGALKLVVSLNWDSVLETAYCKRYGVPLPSEGPILYKPHGDVSRPELPWIMPDQAGSIPGALADLSHSLASSHPRVLVVIGYGERDEQVVNSLIRPLSEKWRVIRIGPQAGGADDIRTSAEDALPALLSATYDEPELQGWDYVNFDTQHGLVDALLGRGLGPANVLTCPRLPEVDAITKTLSLCNIAVVSASAITQNRPISIT